MNHPLHPLHPHAIGWADCEIDGKLVKAFAGNGHEHVQLGADFVAKSIIPTAELLILQSAQRGLELKEYDLFVSVEIIPKFRDDVHVNPGGTDNE